MTEYVEKAAILSKCEEMWNNTDETTQTGVDTINAIDRITDYIESLPAADVQPVRYTEWVRLEQPAFGNPYGCYQCPECKYIVPYEENYCPNCGVKMILRETNETVVADESDVEQGD